MINFMQRNKRHTNVMRRKRIVILYDYFFLFIIIVAVLSLARALHVKPFKLIIIYTCPPKQCRANPLFYK